MGIEVWAAWPSISEETSKRCNEAWKEKGYKTMVLMDGDKKPWTIGTDSHILIPVWKGFPYAANTLCQTALGKIVVLIGDDILPDPQPAQELAKRFLVLFPDTCGVVSPIGDKYGCINRCCIAPWIGRRFIQLAYQGKGPYHTGYYHYFSDEELQQYAIKKKAFHQWSDVSQYHNHWQRRNEQRPPHLLKAKSRWKEDKQLFEKRKKEGFPE